MQKQELSQKLLQKLTPQQIQVIKLLEIPTFQLEQKIKKEIEDNPVLEEDYSNKNDNSEEDSYEDNDNVTNEDEFNVEDYMQDDDIPYYKLATKNVTSDNNKKEEIPFSVGISFRENLENQLNVKMLSDREHTLATYLIGNLDEDGYLRRNIESIVDDLAFNENIETNEKELEDILIHVIQDLEPSGIGARNLQECLLLQINNKDLNDSCKKLAKEILENHFTAFTKKHYDKIEHQLSVSDDQLRKAIDEILKLYPKPGSSYSNSESKVQEHIVPDFILENREGELSLSLNSKNSPNLRLNQTYLDMLEAAVGKKKKDKNKNDKEALSFVRQKVNSAKWFMDAIKQRQATMMLTMQAILDYQYDYFLEGDEKKLKPMILKEIAEMTGLDISTISRVVNSKYIQTHFGIFPLKYFFSEAMQKEGGEEVSSREIKTILNECINNEDKRKPLTDDKLSEILKEKGYNIARRTVAKYREQEGIPVARLRKELT